MLSKAPVAFRCTRMSLDRARRVRGTRAPDLAILFLFSSVMARKKVSNSTHKLTNIAAIFRLTMRREVGDAPDGVALHLDVGAQHLTDQGLESSQLDDRDLVLSCKRNASVSRRTPRPRED